MSYRIEGVDFNDFFSPNAGGANLHSSASDQHKYATNKGDILFKEHKLQNNISIVEGQYALHDDVTIFGKGNTSLLEIQFNLSGKGIHYQNKSKQSKLTNARSGNITFLTEDENQADILFQKNIAYDTFDIHLPVDILHQYAGESKLMDSFLENINKEISTTLINHNMAINSTVYNTILDIKNCKFEGLTRRIYLESKTYELIALLYNATEDQTPSHSLSNVDIEKIHYAASIIRDNIKKPLTIIELSRCIGINQTKLKHGFKLIFKNTVFGYLQDIRMHQAKKYLLDTDFSIQEIAMLVGYQSMSNFSAAFKKHFGHSPIKMK